MPSLDELAAQEERLQFDRFDDDVAWALGAQLVEAARAQELPVAIELRRNGRQVFHAALPGSAPDNDAWLARKARVVDRYEQASFRVGEAARQAGKTFEQQSRLDPDLYAAHGGAFPIRLRGTGVIGSAAVSGLPQLADHEFVVEQLAIFLGEQSRVPGS
jgi:uncharacterized protein (UPF0303 family)